MMPVDPFVHEALYYRDLAEFVAGVLAFVRAGVAAGEPCLVALPEPRLRLIEAELGPARDQVSFVDMAAAGKNPNRILPAVLQAFVDGSRPARVRIISESIYAGRSAEAVAAGVRHESLVNLAFAGIDVAIRCPVDVAALPHLVPYSERTHPVIVAGEVRPSLGFTDPVTMLAILNQPLPEPRRPVDSLVVGDDCRGEVVDRFLAVHADKAGLGASRVADLQCAAAAILAGAAAEGAATLRVWAEPDRIICEIRAPGEVVDLMAGRVLPDPDSPRAHALRAADAWCDLVQTHTSAVATVTRLHVELSAVRHG